MILDEKKFEISDEPKILDGIIIQGSYSTDLNIYELHLIIRDIVSHNISKRKKVNKKITKLKTLLETCDFSRYTRKEIIEKINKKQFFLALFSIEQWKKYCLEIKDVLERYSQITTYTKKKTFFIGEKKKMEKEDEYLFERLELIKTFLGLIKKFVDLNIVFHPPFEIGCSTCGLNIDQMRVDEDKSVYVCNCNYIFGSVYSLETTHVDPDKIDNENNPSYDDKSNFIRRLRSYQGLFSRKVSKEFIDSIDIYMQQKYLLPPASEIREMPPDRYGRRGIGITSVALLKEVLRETNNSIHFQDINPICYNLWGWICPNISSLIPQILDDYRRTQEVYKKMNPDLSSINVELRLYWHLRIVGHECLLEDFKIPQSVESKKRNSYMFQIMCKKTGLPFIPII